VLRPQERYTSRCMVWGVIGVGVKILDFPKGRITAETYIKTLRERLLPKIDIDRHIFMQDGAPAHTAKITKEFLANSNVKLMEWPAKSPDLNPIETVWGMMKARIRVDAFATAETLQKEVMKAWDSISQDQINELVLGFKNRVNKMVERKGKATNVARCYQSP